MRVGFVGLGRMGLPMARNLLGAGHELVIHSRDAKAVEQLTFDGVRSVRSPRDVASVVDVFCSCRVSPDHSLEVFLGADGVVAAGRGGLFLDAPVSGGPGGAASASLSIMVGGSEGDFARGRPVLESLGKTIFHLGGVGSGVSAKLCNNVITGTLHVLIAEAMVLGTKLGIEPALLYEVLRSSSARSNTLERVVPNHFLPGNYEPASALAMMIKDLECVTSTAKSVGVRMLLPAVAQQCYVEAAGLGHGEKDLAAVILPMEEIAQVKVGRARAAS